MTGPWGGPARVTEPPLSAAILAQRPGGRPRPPRDATPPPCPLRQSRHGHGVRPSGGMHRSCQTSSGLKKLAFEEGDGLADQGQDIPNRTVVCFDDDLFASAIRSLAIAPDPLGQCARFHLASLSDGAIGTLVEHNVFLRLGDVAQLSKVC